MTELLRVQGLVKHFPIRKGVLRRQVGWVRAVDGLDFGVAAGKTLSLVGESGCGKSTTGRLLARLIEPTEGRVWLEADELTALPPARLRARRRDIQIMFQDPFSSLSPRLTVAEIIAEPLRVQGLYRSVGGRNRVLELLELVGLRPEHAYRYPHEFSGGQRQRIGLARALALEPKVLILDEPVSALDVSVQAQVVNQLQDLQQRLGLAYVFISHNLSVVRHLSDQIAVMYLGMIVEQGSREQLYQRPRHPYTKALLSAVPIPDPDRRDDRERIRLTGDVPSVSNPPSGCRFRTRCWKAQDVCATTPPPLTELTADGHLSACHFPENVDHDN
ncbi:ABC transporter ATP-binding protein [Microlunatus sp. GCM10028923]|uniref:ABC transporter ATP-binding protein n=1 Tax=Microlunatus sp. GCM10028923 TaxID=3273400 RepID=UPI00361B01F6